MVILSRKKPKLLVVLPCTCFWLFVLPCHAPDQSFVSQVLVNCRVPHVCRQTPWRAGWGVAVEETSKVWMSCKLVLWPFNMSTNPKNTATQKKILKDRQSLDSESLHNWNFSSYAGKNHDIFLRSENVLFSCWEWPTVRCTIWMSLQGTMSNLLWTWFDCSDVSSKYYTPWNEQRASLPLKTGYSPQKERIVWTNHPFSGANC